MTAPFRVMTINLRRKCIWDRKNSWKKRIHRIRSLIDHWQPDVIGTQELTHSMKRDLCELLPNFLSVGKGRYGNHKGEHCAIWLNRARFNPKHHGTFWLSESPDTPKSRSWGSAFTRICTWCEAEDKRTGQNLMFYNTHLDHRSSLARENGLRLIMDKMMDHMQQTPVPVVFMGDLNTSWHLSFADLFPRLCLPEINVQHHLATFHGFKGIQQGEPIDYILHCERLKCTEYHIDQQTYEGGFPSDHYPAIATFIVG